jgi:[1-hydroxy-2-(trimethylamino)ethyl]phosphonate dioxygenase
VSALEEIRDTFARRGMETYGEGVSQLEHALQCAMCAERDKATPALIAATLLHDIGHLIHDLPPDIADQGIDAQHESLGSAFLSRHFGPDVTEPVRLHVAAKRYLAASERGYFDLLSPASVQSLHVQGGLMSAEERARFAAERFAEDAIKLRRWDDEGKVVGLPTPGLDHFERYVTESLRSA